MTNLEIPSEHSGATFLEGQLLVAMPRMTDRRFRRSVVYLCAHSREGAMGLIVNQQVDDIDFGALLERLGLPDGDDTGALFDLPEELAGLPIHRGGPV
ncbi:MAG: YqgE/AlgH family protein, partial [Hyphomicrobiaceae bacterium]|nr:YqgE/AlgH family protein [Hyphomicrobiaceae bacterium]